MAEKKAQKKPTAPAAASAKPVGSAARDVGIDVPIPTTSCTDPKCPFHGRLPVRGQMLEGVVVSTRMQNTVVIERQYPGRHDDPFEQDRKTTRLNSSHRCISYAVFCLKKKKKKTIDKT